MNTTIKVKYVNEPKSPNGPGSIKTPDGILYKVWPPRNGKPGIALSEFREGGTYEVEYREEEYQGKPQRTAVKIIGSASNGTNGSANGQSNGSTGGGESSGSRSARIERQCAQKCAVAYFANREAPTDEVLRAKIDWFQADLENAERVKAEADEAKALADGSDNGGEGAGFEV